jgi:hypothetical protein
MDLGSGEMWTWGPHSVLAAGPRPVARRFPFTSVRVPIRTEVRGGGVGGDRRASHDERRKQRTYKKGPITACYPRIYLASIVYYITPKNTKSHKTKNGKWH